MNLELMKEVKRRILEQPKAVDMDNFCASTSTRSRKASTRAERISMIRPLHDRIIVQRFDTAVDKVGSIYIPDAAKERPNQGDVLAVGKGKRTPDGVHHHPLVKVGDKILFGKYSGTEVKVDGRELLIVREDEIMGVIE